MWRGFRNSPDNSPPRFRAGFGELPELPNAAVSGREWGNPTVLRATGRHTGDTPQVQDSTVMSRAAVPLSTRQRGRKCSPQRGTALVVFGSSKGTRLVQVPDHSPNGAQNEAPQTAHTQSYRIS